MATPREHIEDIWKTKFKDNPLTEGLHQAIKLLSAEGNLSMIRIH